MPIIIPVLLGELLKEVVLPELVDYIKKRYESTGQWPTVEEINERIDLKATKVVMKADTIIERLEKKDA